METEYQLSACMKSLQTSMLNAKKLVKQIQSSDSAASSRKMSSVLFFISLKFSLHIKGISLISISIVKT